MSSLRWMLKVGVWALIPVMSTACAAPRKAIVDKREPRSSQRPSETPTATELETANKLQVQAAYRKLPLHFQANRNQSDEQGKFLFHRLCTFGQGA